jgi:multidrug efflux pump subunit AcrA (membrane-fusion protein)
MPARRSSPVVGVAAGFWELFSVKRRLLSKPFIIGIVVVLIAAGAGTFLLTRGDPATVSYRTGVATLGTVTQTVSLSGNLAPDGETDLDFEGAGKVTSVNVQPGQTVTAGEALATQDPTTVDDSLTQANATLAGAEANLSLARAGTSASSLSQAEGQVNSAEVSYQSSLTNLSDTKAVNAQQTAQAYSAYTTAQAQATTDGCTPNDTTPPCPQDEAAITQDYQQWQASVVKGRQGDDQAQDQVNADKVQWENAKSSLAALEDGSTSTSAQIAMDESQVEVDQVNVATAQAAVNAATLKAPSGGIVEEVNVTNGEEISSGGTGGASSGSSGAATHAIVIITPGVFEVTGSVSDTLVNEIAIGQTAEVVAAGSSEAVAGKVTEVAEEATVTSGVASFPVTVVLSGASPSLRPGMSASVSVVINQVVGVTTVPTSAVHTTGAGSIVDLFVNGKPVPTAVTVGAADATLTQILSGVKVGDTVVIATITSTIPSSTTGSGRSLTGGGGFFGGGGSGFTGGGGARAGG